MEEELCMHHFGDYSLLTPKVTILKIRWKIPIEISPLKMGTKNPKKKYVQEYPTKQFFLIPDFLCTITIPFCQPRKILPRISGENIKNKHIVTIKRISI